MLRSPAILFVRDYKALTVHLANTGDVLTQYDSSRWKKPFTRGISKIPLRRNNFTILVINVTVHIQVK